MGNGYGTIQIEELGLNNNLFSNLEMEILNLLNVRGSADKDRIKEHIKDSEQVMDHLHKSFPTLTQLKTPEFDGEEKIVDNLTTATLIVLALKNYITLSSGLYISTEEGRAYLSSQNARPIR